MIPRYNAYLVEPSSNKDNYVFTHFKKHDNIDIIDFLLCRPLAE